MKLLHRLVRLLVFMVLLGVGVTLCCLAWGGDTWEAFTSFLGRTRFLGWCLGGGGICLAFLFALSSIDHRRKEKFLSFENEGGRVNISTQAISDYVSKLSAEFPSMVKMVPRVVSCRKGIDIIVEVRIKAGPQLHEICEVLQKRVRETMINGLGIPEVRRVVVCVKEISSEHRTS